MNRIAIAIFAGCVAIAVALYFGLRDRAPAVAPTPPIAPIAPIAPANGPTALAPVAPLSRDALHALEMQATAQLELDRPRMVEKCWTGPRDRSSYQLQIAISPDGREIGRSLLEQRGTPSRPDVAACVRGLPPRVIAVAPPGSPVTLTIPLVLP